MSHHRWRSPRDRARQSCRRLGPRAAWEPEVGKSPQKPFNPSGKGSCPCAERERKAPMGYRSREKKRQAKAAIARVKRDHHDTMRTRYYLTFAKKGCRCSSCGRRLRVNDQLVYRHDGPVTLCLPCGEADPLVDYRISLRWEKQRWRERRAA